MTYVPVLAARVRGVGVQVCDAACEITVVVVLARDGGVVASAVVLAPLALHHDGEPDDVVARLDRWNVPSQELVSGGEGAVGQVGEVRERRGRSGGEGCVEMCEAWEV